MAKLNVPKLFSDYARSQKVKKSDYDKEVRQNRLGWKGEPVIPPTVKQKKPTIDSWVMPYIRRKKIKEI